MSSDVNIFKNNYNIQTEQRKVVIDQDAITRTLKKIAAPVFDFFTKEEAPVQEVNPFVNYEEKIETYELRSAKIEKILKDADPNSRTHFNIVI